MDIQTIIVYIIVALCIIYAVRGFIKTLNRKGGCSSCGKNCCCNSKSNKCTATGGEICHCNENSCDTKKK